MLVGTIVGGHLLEMHLEQLLAPTVLLAGILLPIYPNEVLEARHR